MSILSVAVLLILGVTLSLSARRTILEAWPKVVSVLRSPVADGPVSERSGPGRAPAFVRPPMVRRTNLPSRIAA